MRIPTMRISTLFAKINYPTGIPLQTHTFKITSQTLKESIQSILLYHITHCLERLGLQLPLEIERFSRI